MQASAVRKSLLQCYSYEWTSQQQYFATKTGRERSYFRKRKEKKRKEKKRKKKREKRKEKRKCTPVNEHDARHSSRSITTSGQGRFHL